ncbi:MAG: hypothetical protein J6R33_00085, partial [Clostridia bacterium]|nr:hypothetical protein [Clostridia bacterium]
EKYGYSQNEDIVLLILTREWETNYYDMYTYGAAYDRISTKEVNRILDSDDVYDNIKYGSLSSGVIAFVEHSSVAYSGRFGAPLAQLILISLALGLLVGLIVCVCVVAAYKMKMQPTNYPLEKYTSLTLTKEMDTFAGQVVTHRVIHHNSSSGGRSGGRSGGSRGGGGGHRGGR